MDVVKEVDAVVDHVTQLLATYGLEVLGAVLILIVGWTIAGWAHGSTRRAMERAKWMDGTLKPLAAAIVRYAVLAITVIAVLNQFGVQTTSIIAVLGAAGLTVGLALQGTLSNVAAGVMILFLRPFKVGDSIEAAGKGGTVREVGLFSTELATADNVFIAVPNSQIVGGAITNYSRNPTRRIDLVAGVAVADLEKTVAELAGLAGKDGRILAEPAPQTTVRSVAGGAVEIGLRFWVKSNDFGAAGADVLKLAKDGLDRAGVEIKSLK